MKNIKARLAVLAVLAVSIMGLVGVSAPAASAAICYGGQSTTYWTGLLNFDARAQSCDHVDKVQFQVAYWHDTTWDVNYGAFGNPTVYTETVGGHGVPAEASHTFQTPSWCSGANHGVWTYYNFRIHNTANGGSWGSWYHSQSLEYRILC